MHIFIRLLGFLRPYRKGVSWAFVLAFGAMLATVLIPFLTGEAINGIRANDKHDLIAWAIAIGVAGILRFGSSGGSPVGGGAGLARGRTRSP